MKTLILILFYLSLVPNSWSQEIEKTLLLYKESAPLPGFSFLNDEGDQMFRLFPFFVKYDGLDWSKGYEDTLYTFPSDRLPKQITMEEVLLLLHDTITDTNLILIDVRHLTRKINKTYRHLGLKKPFNGFLYYRKYLVTFKCQYGGNRNILLPVPKQLYQKKKQLMYFKPCEIYYFTSVQSIVPIN